MALKTRTQPARTNATFDRELKSNEILTFHTFEPDSQLLFSLYSTKINSRCPHWSHPMTTSAGIAGRNIGGKKLDSYVLDDEY